MATALEPLDERQIAANLGPASGIFWNLSAARRRRRRLVKAMLPIRARLAVYLVLAADNERRADGDPEILRIAKAIASSLSESEFQAYAGEYDESRVSWELARAVGATAN